jgi:hypothetical protein
VLSANAKIPQVLENREKKLVTRMSRLGELLSVMVMVKNQSILGKTVRH